MIFFKVFQLTYFISLVLSVLARPSPNQNSTTPSLLEKRFLYNRIFIQSNKPIVSGSQSVPYEQTTIYRNIPTTLLGTTAYDSANIQQEFSSRLSSSMAAKLERTGNLINGDDTNSMLFNQYIFKKDLEDGTTLEVADSDGKIDEQSTFTYDEIKQLRNTLREILKKNAIKITSTTTSTSHTFTVTSSYTISFKNNENTVTKAQGNNVVRNTPAQPFWLGVFAWVFFYI